MQDSKRDTDIQNSLLNSVGEGEGGCFGRMALNMYNIIHEMNRQSRFDA